MKHAKRRRWIAILSLVTVLTLGIVISLLVLGSPERDFTATAYSNLIRFQAEGVATLQVRIFDLSGKEVWDSGMVSGDTIDWDRRNDLGERLAYGAYIYSAQGWNAEGDLIFQKNGKLALMPGDKVQLQAAPVVLPLPSDTLAPYSASDGRLLAPMGYTPGVSTFDQVGIGTTDPTQELHIKGNTGALTLQKNSGDGSIYFDVLNSAGVEKGYFGYGSGNWDLFVANLADANMRFYNDGDTRLFIQKDTGNVGIGTTDPTQELHIKGNTGALTLQKNSGDGSIYFDVLNSAGVEKGYFGYGSGNWDFYVANLADANMQFYNDGATRLFIQKDTGNVGIGTTSPVAKLEVESSTGQDLIAAYPSSSRVAGAAVFVVKSTGEVRADGAYYSGAGDYSTGGFNTGGADVAERINVSEWVEPGNVVEIDPEHPGFFRKSSSPYSTKVAGIISTSPGVVLGNSFDETTDDWEDNRPVLAVTGRVPCKVSAENGPIAIGDLLVASSTPGIAMKGNSAESMGAVVGKAMEPLDEGEGTIVVQVMLR